MCETIEAKNSIKNSHIWTYYTTPTLFFKKLLLIFYLVFTRVKWPFSTSFTFIYHTYCCFRYIDPQLQQQFSSLIKVNTTTTSGNGKIALTLPQARKLRIALFLCCLYLCVQSFVVGFSIGIFGFLFPIFVD